jgi:MFS superfamily sulfate permease-like transporter
MTGRRIAHHRRHRPFFGEHTGGRAHAGLRHPARLWILGLVALAPALLTLVPLSALAAVLLVTGWRLISLRHVRHLFEHHGLVPVGIWAVTVAMVVLQDLLVGVALGLALSIIEIVPYLRRKLAIRHAEIDEEIHVQLGGAVTCKDVPILLNTFEQLPEGRK